MKIEISTGGANFLKAHDLRGDTVATIERVEEKTIHNPYKNVSEPQVVAYFTLASNPGQLVSMICNKTVCRQLMAALDSPETDDWIGQQVVLFPTTASNGKPCVRAKPCTEDSEL